MNTRTLTALGLLCLSTWTAHVPASETQEWHFTAYLDDKRIGHHRFALTESGGTRELISEARFNVRFLIFDAYRYVHESREYWNGDCLTRIDASTNANGERFRVQGRDTARGFVVDSGETLTLQSECVMTFAYWNPRFLDQPRLLNAQNGDYVAVSIRDLGLDTVTVRGSTREARRYGLEGPGIRIELWYSPAYEWLGLDSVTEDGKRLRYRLDTPTATEDETS